MMRLQGTGHTGSRGTWCLTLPCSGDAARPHWPQAMYAICVRVLLALLTLFGGPLRLHQGRQANPSAGLHASPSESARSRASGTRRQSPWLQKRCFRCYLGVRLGASLTQRAPDGRDAGSTGTPGLPDTAAEAREIKERGPKGLRLQLTFVLGPFALSLALLPSPLRLSPIIVTQHNGRTVLRFPYIAYHQE